MVNAVGRENFESDGEENGPMVGRNQEREEVVDDSKEKEDENTNIVSQLELHHHVWTWHNLRGMIQKPK